MSAEFPIDLLAWIELLGRALLHFLWQGLLIAFVYRIGRSALELRGPAAQAVCGQAAFGLFALAPFLTLGLLASGRGAAGMSASEFDPGTAIDASVPWEPWSPEAASLPLLWLVVALWSSGVLGLSLRNLLAWRRDARLVAAARPAPTELQRHCARLAARLQLQIVPELRELVGLATPCLVGWLRPVILLPLGLATRLPAAQLEALMLHELAHLRRVDYLANLVQTAIETLLFYHPAVHWVGRQLRADRERACDDLVLDARVDRMDYARALANLELGRQALPVLALAASGGALLGRIERILRADTAQARGVGRLASTDRRLPTLLALGCAALLGVVALQRAEHSAMELALELGSARLPIEPITLKPPTLQAELPLWRRIETLPQPGVQRPTPVISDSAQPREVVPALDEPDRRAPAHAQALQNTPAQSHPVPTLATHPPAVISLAPSPGQGATVRDEPPAVLEPRLLRGGAPAYPRRARINGQEGQVVLSFAVDQSGRARDIQIESASPAGVFEAAARSALREAEFAYQPEFAGRVFRRSFDFRLADPSEAIDAAPLFGRCEPTVGTRICRER